MLSRYNYDLKSFYEIDFYENKIDNLWNPYKKVYRRAKKYKYDYKYGYIVTRLYLLNKNYWYTQKKNCLLFNTIIKPYKLTEYTNYSFFLINSIIKWF